MAYADVKRGGLGPISCQVEVSGRDGAKLFVPPREILANARVRYVGESVALLLAESLAEALNAVEPIDVDYAPLAGVTNTGMADKEGGHWFGPI